MNDSIFKCTELLKSLNKFSVVLDVAHRLAGGWQVVDSKDRCGGGVVHPLLLALSFALSSNYQHVVNSAITNQEVNGSLQEDGICEPVTRTTVLAFL